MLQVRFYGTRGSISVSGKEYEEFGGNTTCVQIRTADSGRIAILDAGTGIRKCGNDFLDTNRDQKDIFIAFSHFHWDHIQGFPFFAPAYDKNRIINILALGEGRKFENLRDIFDVQMQDRFFPISMDEMGATFNFLTIDKHSAVFTPPDNVPVTVTAVRHNHPGDAYSYRYERDGIAVVISTDIEHGDTIDENIVALARDANLLIHDAQYTSEELKAKKGWGHSSYDQAIEVAERANVKQLVLTHHDPEHDDDFLRKQEAVCKEKFSNCMLSREGMVLNVQ